MPATVYCADHHAWRDWLEANHTSVREIWLLFPKKHTGKPSVSYSEALDEALCFGWIDSLIKRIDDDWYARKFTPRSDNQNWSAVNKRHVARLIKGGRMLPAGLAKLGLDPKSEKPRPRLDSFKLTPDVIRSLKTNSKAWDNFNKLAPSHRQRYTVWIMSAKQDETRQRRVTDTGNFDALGDLAARVREANLFQVSNEFYEKALKTDRAKKNPIVREAILRVIGVTCNVVRLDEPVQRFCGRAGKLASLI